MFMLGSGENFKPESGNVREANQGEGAPPYVRHRPEQTLLYQLIAEYYPRFVAQCAFEGRLLPDYVWQEFEDYLKCGRLEYGFLRVHCEDCKHEHLVAFSCKRRGICCSGQVSCNSPDLI
jgi:hypothetical protein